MATAKVQERIDALRELLHLHPQAFEGAAEIAARCQVALDFRDVRFPGFPVPQGETPFSVLWKLI